MKYAAKQNRIMAGIACFLLRRLAWLALASFVALSAARPGAAQAEDAKVRLTYQDIVQRQTDLHRLALLPVPGERSILFSSHDRASIYDEATDSYRSWDANADGQGVIRQEGRRYVLAESEGPGALVRIWSATPGPGKVSIYLDGASTPLVETAFRNYFTPKFDAAALPTLVYEKVSPDVAGSNNFIPIVFSKSIKIVADKDWGSYYQFTIARFGNDTSVASTTFPFGTAELNALREADAVLRRSQNPSFANEGAGEPQTFVVPPNSSRTIYDVPGSGLITHFSLALDLPGEVEKQRTLLGSVAIRMTWDNGKPAVWAPIDAFFGSFGGAEPYTTLAQGVTASSRYYSNWVMPFASRARIEIVNDSAQPVTLLASVTVTALRRPINDYGRFHAKWHRNLSLPARNDRAIDWTLLSVAGRGRLVGVHLHVWNPVKGWWGEGDEKIFVDGEKFPSIFGTGTEDFFGFAWSSAGVFKKPMHNQILNEGNAGHAALTRLLVIDNVPFQKRLDAFIEKYFPDSRPTLYSSTSYWYSNADDDQQEVPLAERFYWR